MLDELRTLATDYLAGVFPADFTNHPGYIVAALVHDSYPTGWEGFVEDSALATACS